MLGVSPDPEAMTNEVTDPIEATPAGVVLDDDAPSDIARFGALIT